jgi:hypothetical protein
MNENQRKIRNLPLLELFQNYRQSLETDKKRYNANHTHYNNNVVNSDKPDIEKKRLGEKLRHDYWRNLTNDELLQRFDNSPILPFLVALEEGRRQAKIRGDDEFQLFFNSKTGKVNVM